MKTSQSLLNRGLQISIILHLWIKIRLAMHFCAVWGGYHMYQICSITFFCGHKGLFWQSCEDPWLVLALVLIEAEIPSAVSLSILSLIDVLSGFWTQKVSPGLQLSIISITAKVCCCLVVGFSVFWGYTGWQQDLEKPLSPECPSDTIHHLRTCLEELLGTDSYSIGIFMYVLALYISGGINKVSNNV